MSEVPLTDPIFATAAMAEILLDQNLVDDARAVIEELKERNFDSSRLADLYARLEEISKQIEPVPVEPKGADRVAIEVSDEAVWIEWETTADGLEMAKRRVRYSGRTIVRVFRAAMGPRGVRTSSQDIEATLDAARIELVGLPRNSVCVAAVGFLSNTGEFVPLSSTEPVAVSL